MFIKVRDWVLFDHYGFKCVDDAFYGLFKPIKEFKRREFLVGDRDY